MGVIPNQVDKSLTSSGKTGQNQNQVGKLAPNQIGKAKKSSRARKQEPYNKNSIPKLKLKTPS